MGAGKVAAAILSHAVTMDYMNTYGFNPKPKVEGSNPAGDDSRQASQLCSDRLGPTVPFTRR